MQLDGEVAWYNAQGIERGMGKPGFQAPVSHEAPWMTLGNNPTLLNRTHFRQLP